MCVCTSLHILVDYVILHMFLCMHRDAVQRLAYLNMCRCICVYIHFRVKVCLNLCVRVCVRVNLSFTFSLSF